MRARLAFLTQTRGLRRVYGPGGYLPGGPTRVPPHDAPRRTRPALRGPRTPRGPLNRSSNPFPDRGIGSPMIKPMSAGRRYRIVIRGECGKLLTGLVDNAQVVTSQNGDTCVVAAVRDDPEFWGLMEQFQELALHVISLQDLDHDNGQATAPGASE